MPIYEYQCQPNSHRFEVRHGMNESPVQECPECGGPVRRVIHPVGIVFKGSGFYATDSRTGSTGSSTPSGSTTESKSDSSSATAESSSTTKESKTDSTAD